LSRLEGFHKVSSMLAEDLRQRLRQPGSSVRTKKPAGNTRVRVQLHKTIGRKKSRK
jgi:hypothetical protein